MHLHTFLTHPFTADNKVDHARYKCKSCDHVFGETPRYPNYNISKAQYELDIAAYWASRKEWERVVSEHLTTNHPIVSCQFCKTLLNKPTLKSHQKSYTCTVQQRRGIMEEQGYRDVTGYLQTFTDASEEMLAVLLRGIANDNDQFDNEDLRKEIVAAQREAILLFHQLAGIKLAYSAYNKISPQLHTNDPKNGWQLTAWAPQDTWYVFMFLLKKWEKVPPNERRFSTVKIEAYLKVWEWLYEDEAGRYNTLGGWDLAESGNV